MSDNQANPTKGAETDLQKAAKSISGLLSPETEVKPKEKDVKPITEEAKPTSAEPIQQESSKEEQPAEQETKPETESQEEVSEQEVSQEQTQEIQQEQDSTHKVKVAGQEFNVSLDELKNGYSRDADYRRKTEELALDKKQFQSESEKQRQNYSSKLEELNRFNTIAQQQLTEEFNSSNLDKLYEEDPVEATKIKHRLDKKQLQLNHAMQTLQERHRKERNDIIEKEGRSLVLKTPEFNDKQKSMSIRNEMRNFLSSQGFNNYEIASIIDHRQIMIVNDAMKYRNMLKSKPNLAKKITKPGKVFSSGVKSDKADINLQKRKEKLGRLKKSGNIKDATSIFLDMINNKQQ